MDFLKGSAAVVAVLALAACTPAAQSPAATVGAGAQLTVEAAAQSPATGTVVAGAQATATSSFTVNTADDPGLGTILVDANGMTLYRYTKDEANTSKCYDQCAQNWPPLKVSGQPVLAPGVPGTLDVTQRTDGTNQVTYNGMPLYYYVKDTDPGNTYGQGVGSVWFTVTPAAQ